VLIRRQFVLTLALMPITFGIWYAADSLFAGPAVWLCDLLLSFFYPDIVQAAGLQGATMLLTTQFGEINGQILPAQEVGNQIALEINTRLVSYSIAFYAALLTASNLQDSITKFCIGLFWLTCIMGFGLASIVGKDLLLMVGPPFLAAPGHRPQTYWR